MNSIDKYNDLMEQKNDFCFSKRQKIYNSYIKRSLDFVLAIFALCLLLPVFVLITLAIMIEAKTFCTRVFFVQKRLGLNGKVFKIYKFRSMHYSAPCAVATNDFTDSCSYITKVGSFLRKTSLDELPQLLNVLKGDMSIVGPRPLIPEEKKIASLREHFSIYAVRPGITGLAQVSGRDNMDIYTKTQFDRQYLENLSWRYDLFILGKTIRVVLKRENIAF